MYVCNVIFMYIYINKHVYYLDKLLLLFRDSRPTVYSIHQILGRVCACVSVYGNGENVLGNSPHLVL